MIALPRLREATERLDEPAHEDEELRTSLGHIASVNRWLGGDRSILLHLEEMLPPAEPARILDVGTGSGDLPRRIVRWARRHGRTVHVVGADIHPQMLAVARAQSRDFPEITFEQADGLSLPFETGSFDCALNTLTLHHFTDEEQLTVLRELQRVSSRGIIVSDLERNWPNYLGARVLAATVWRSNRLTSHDGPISVLRALTPVELLDRARKAGLPSPRVDRHFFYRLVLTTAVHPVSAPAAP
jgi:SAM-dependent methyltransferase